MRSNYLTLQSVTTVPLSPTTFEVSMLYHWERYSGEMTRLSTVKCQEKEI